MGADAGALEFGPQGSAVEHGSERHGKQQEDGRGNKASICLGCYELLLSSYLI